MKHKAPVQLGRRVSIGPGRHERTLLIHAFIVLDLVFVIFWGTIDVMPENGASNISQLA
jgi:hypothetical protein